MKFFSYLMIIFCIPSCQQDTNLVVTQTYFDTSKTKIKSEGTIDKVSQLKEGIWKNYNRKGKLVEEGPYKSDQQTGTWKYFHPSGKVKSKGELLNGKKEGIWKHFYDDGDLSFTANYVNNQQDGKCQAFYKNGKLSTESFYKNGKLNGAHITFSSKNPDTTLYLTYVDNIRMGLFKKYHDGKPYVVGYWKPEVGLIGKVYHYRNEKLIKVEYKDNDGKTISTEFTPKSRF
ncbi:MAG: toxin-antitoxin system YwqK family antitoxin [Saprospiraceae bacterium]